MKHTYNGMRNIYILNGESKIEYLAKKELSGSVLDPWTPKWVYGGD